MYNLTISVTSLGLLQNSHRHIIVFPCDLMVIDIIFRFSVMTHEWTSPRTLFLRQNKLSHINKAELIMSKFLDYLDLLNTYVDDSDVVSCVYRNSYY